MVRSSSFRVVRPGQHAKLNRVRHIRTGQALVMTPMQKAAKAVDVEFDRRIRAAMASSNA